MTHEEIYALFDKVTDVIQHYRSYHVSYCWGDESWTSDGLSVSFEVYGYSDQGEGAEWKEYWMINTDGAISNGEGDIWNTFEDFEREWV